MKFDTHNLVTLPSTPTLECFAFDWPEICYSFTWVDGQAVHVSSIGPEPSVYFTKFYVQTDELQLLVDPNPVLTAPAATFQAAAAVQLSAIAPPVPEPATAVLMAFSLIVVAIARRVGR